MATAKVTKAPRKPVGKPAKHQQTATQQSEQWRYWLNGGER